MRGPEEDAAKIDRDKEVFDAYIENGIVPTGKPKREAHENVHSDNLYERLGLKRTASPGEIEEAYKRMMRAHDPDQNPGKYPLDLNPAKIRIDHAYEVLSDPVKRKHYDRSGADANFAEIVDEAKLDAGYIWENDIVRFAARLNKADYQRLKKALKDAGIKSLTDWNKDVSSLAKEMTQTVEVNPEDEVDAAAAWETCKELANTPNILEVLKKDLYMSGTVGNLRNECLVYLVMTSRFFAKPMSACFKGTTSSGKSHAIEKVLVYVPSHAYIQVSGMSQKAMIFDQERYSHRIIVMAEADGIMGDDLDYFLRTLLSEHRINYRVVDKDKNGKLVTHVINKEGPIGTLMTTTRNALHPENETRFISLRSDDSPDLTRRVLLTHAKGERLYEPDFERWHALHKWLQGQVHEVEIPYAGLLAEYASVTQTRMRRDFTQVLSCIRASAVLHQANREIKAGKVIATLDDYRVAHELLADGLAVVHGVSIPKDVRKVVETVRSLAGNPSLRAVERASDLEYRRCHRAVNDAKRLGYLIDMNPNPGRGSHSELATGDVKLPESDYGVLPSPEHILSKQAKVPVSDV